MHSYYAKTRAINAQRQIDGHDYVMTHYALGEQGADALLTLDKPRMMRVCFVTNGEAYVLLGRRGDAIALTCPMPDDVLDSYMVDA